MSSYVFVDSRVRDIYSLLADFAPDVQVIILDSTQDGIAQIAAALEGVTDLDAIHIVSHGSEGTLYLGDTVLTSDNLDSYSSDLAAIGAALNSAGDILLYGCEVANGVTGLSFIDKLSRYTGADVAASTDNTGNAALSGDWQLEASSGVIEARALASTAFDGLLAPPALTPAGTLDKSFDTDGKLTTSFGTGASADQIYSLALQADGKIVAAGSSSSDFALVRYNANGALDTTFDTDGKVTTAIGTGTDQISSLALQADGKIVAAGLTHNGPNFDFALARYNTNGTLDTTFDGDGKLLTAISTGYDSVNSIALQADGKIVAAGSSANASLIHDFALARYNDDGNLDTTFSGDGKLTTAIGTGNDAINSIALQADGKIVAAGSSHNGANDDFALARYNADGSLDTTFSGDGKLTTAIGTGTDQITSLALQADGKIVVAGYSFNGANNDFALARYNTDGTLDTTFDGDGKLTTAIDTARTDQITSLALQADGKIVVAGFTNNGANNDIALARYNTDGTLDNTFDGDGKLITAVGTGNDVIRGMALQADGAIVVGGVYDNDFALVRVVGGGTVADSGIPNVTATENSLFSFTFNANTFTDPEAGELTYSVGALPAWLNFNPATRTFSGTPLAANVGSVTNVTVTAADGEAFSVSDTFAIKVQNNEAPTLYLDRSFDGDGKLTAAFGTGTDRFTSLALQADGKIVAAGISLGANADFALARYNTNGTLDATFDGNGKLTTAVGTGDDVCNSIALQADGKIVAAGSSSGDFALARYNTNGNLDTTFDTDGKLTTSFGVVSDVVNSVALQADGKIVAAGSSYPFDNVEFALARYNTNGTLDTTFDGDGKLTTAIGTGTDSISGVALQADGKIVVAGSSFNGTNDDFALARYNTNGTLDTTFDGDGRLTTAIGTNNDVIGGMALQADGKIVVAGSSFNGANNDFALARYNTDGTLDSTFSGDGKLTTAIGTGDDQITSLALQADGKIVVAGYSFNGANNDLALARYNTNGTLDTTFDGDGKLTLPVGTGHDNASSVKVQGDGTIVVTGGATGMDGTVDFAVIRIPGTPGIADKTSAHSTPLTHAVTAFTDPEGGPLAYSATLADGTALPAWLTFNVVQTFSGTPSQANVGRYDIKVTATDIWGAASFDVFALAVTNTNGTSGNDTLYGGLGADTMTGLAGNDVYIVDNAGDAVTEAVSAGTDLVRAWVSHSLAADVENLTLMGSANISGTGNTLNNLLTGNSAANQLTGGTGNDTLDGGSGVDTMSGGDGSDYYYVRNVGDSVGETNAVAATGGTDFIYTYLAAYTLTANVENGRINSTGAANLTGNTLNNLLYAGKGDNVLNGSTGTDTVSFYYGVNGAAGVTVSLVPATAQATGGSGSDTLTGFEHLYGSNNADSLTGNTGANKMIGYTGNDTLDGGSGVDTMTGADGSDYYYVRDVGDSVSETNADAATGGTDFVYTYLAAYTLTANVENGRINSTGTANLTGNALDNIIYAGKGDNVLNGSTGTDTITFYYGVNGATGVTVSLVPATAQATGGSGSDTLTGFEHLYGSNNADNLTGNGGGNKLTGYAGNDTLNGGDGNDTLTGGNGKDSITGGIGSDRFDFNALSEMGTTNLTWDVISDFFIGQDKIDLATLDANTATATNDAFTGFISSGSAFTTAGQLKFSSGVLYGNTDADSTAEFAIELLGIANLTTSDLLL
jgi:uncharacterized delta-60 repeat protein